MKCDSAKCENLYKYQINYLYVFSNSMDFHTIGLDGDNDYIILGLSEKHNPILVGSMANDIEYGYVHQFKCNETLLLTTNVEDGYMDMQIDLKEATRDCEYISFICGLESCFFKD